MLMWNRIEIKWSLQLKETDPEDGLNNKEDEAVMPGKGLLEFVKGDQVAIDELEEINLGTNENLRPTFIIENIPLDVKESDIDFLD